jgi:alpha,alpha-trehalase
MFEKFSISDIDSAGRGGEYTVQAGFGWTNGVVLLLASEYGDVLVKPTCPDILAQVGSSGSSTSQGGSSGARGKVGGGLVGTVTVGVLSALAVLL